MRKLLLGILLLLLPSSALCKKLDPKDFNLTATVTAVSSHDETTSSRTTKIDPCAGMGANDPRRARVNCEPTQSQTSYGTVTSFVLTASVGDKIYELQGFRLELGTYHARFTTRSHRTVVELLIEDAKGKLSSRSYEIVGEHLAKAQ